MVKQTVPETIFILILGIHFAIPSQANIGYMIVEALANSSPTESFSNLVPFFKVIFNLLGVLTFIAEIRYIVRQIKKGNYF
ncbi:hypothetical protein K8R33_02735 [archaeon]|nr:hypothetical protein [archaeon]